VEVYATEMPTNESAVSIFCRRLTEFDLRRPGGAKRAGRLPWETLM
jgi:hypothetical protein